MANRPVIFRSKPGRLKYNIRLAVEKLTMYTGSELVETWIPEGGFRIERRRIRTPECTAAVAECLVPMWESGELAPDRPCARQPCLHRIVADCEPERRSILDLAGRYGLLTVRPARSPDPGRPLPSRLLAPEPLDVWKREIRELRAVEELYDRAAEGDLRGRAMLTRRINANLAGEGFHLASGHGDTDTFRLCYRPINLRAALWQRFAEEVAGLIACIRCAAPGCSRWFPGNTVRRDKRFCSAACRNRAFRKAIRVPAAGLEVGKQPQKVRFTRDR